jgi:hypothetical protein
LNKKFYGFTDPLVIYPHAHHTNACRSVNLWIINYRVLVINYGWVEWKEWANTHTLIVSIVIIKEKENNSKLLFLLIFTMLLNFRKYYFYFFLKYLFFTPTMLCEWVFVCLGTYCFLAWCCTNATIERTRE